MEQDALLEGVRRYTIHGAPYVQVYYSLPGNPSEILTCQLPIEAFDDDLKPGDAITLTLLLKTVMEVRRRG